MRIFWPWALGRGLVVVDADLDVVQLTADDLGEEREALDRHVRGGREALVHPQLVRGLALGEVHGEAVGEHEQAAQDHDDDQQYSKRSHAVVPPPGWSDSH